MWRGSIADAEAEERRAEQRVYDSSGPHGSSTMPPLSWKLVDLSVISCGHLVAGRDTSWPKGRARAPAAALLSGRSVRMEGGADLK
jgi:hypothetical protein